MEEISEDLFVSLSEEKIKEMLICPILPHFLRNPKMCGNCEAHICEDCFTKTLEMNSCCPLCRCEIKRLQKPSKIIVNLLETLVVKCQHWEEGCDFKSSPASMSFLEHPSLCLYCLASCPNYQCTIVTPRYLLSNHMDLCSLEPIPCQFCDELQKRRDMSAHLDLCEAKKTCKFCQTIFSSKKNENHEETCPAARFLCVHCRCLFKREEIVGHTSVCQVKIATYKTPRKNNVFNVGMGSPQNGITYGSGNAYDDIFNVGMVSPQRGMTYGSCNTFDGGIGYSAERNLMQSNPGLHQLNLIRGQSLPQEFRTLQELMEIQNQEIALTLTQNKECNQNFSEIGSRSSNNNLNLAQNVVRNLNLNLSSESSTDASGNLSQNLSSPQKNRVQLNGNDFEQTQTQSQRVICLKCNQIVILRDFELHKRECKTETQEANSSQNILQMRSPSRNQNNGHPNFNLANQNYGQYINLGTTNNNNKYMNSGIGVSNAGQPQMIMVNQRNLVMYRN